MIRHIVFFKLEEYSKKNVEVLKEKLLSLKEHISYIKHIEVGVDFNRSKRAYDVALIVDFDTKEQLKAYAIDEYHQKVISYIRENNMQTKVVDYEI